MPDPAKPAELWAQALSSEDKNTSALAPVLADDITVTSAMGTTDGKDAVLATFGQSPIAALFAAGKWSDPEIDGNSATMRCTFAAGAPVKGLTVRVTVDDDDRINRVESTVVQAGPPTAKPVNINDAMAETVNGALVNGTPFVVAYVDDRGQPHLSFRGSVQTYSDHQLALWIRNPQGGLLAAIGDQPRLALFYRDSRSRTTYQFHGRAHVDNTAAVRDRVYNSSPEQERNFDPQRRGIGVIVDIDHIEGRDAGGIVLMDRDAGWPPERKVN